MTSKSVEVTIIVVEVRVVFAEGIRRGLAAKVGDHLHFVIRPWLCFWSKAMVINHETFWIHSQAWICNMSLEWMFLNGKQKLPLKKKFVDSSEIIFAKVYHRRQNVILRSFSTDRVSQEDGKVTSSSSSSSSSSLFCHCFCHCAAHPRPPTTSSSSS